MPAGGRRQDPVVRPVRWEWSSALEGSGMGENVGHATISDAWSERKKQWMEDLE